MEQLLLKPEELFALGKRMNGEFYLYDYYSAIPPVEAGEGKKLLWRAESALTEKGILEEDDEGELTVTPEAEALLRPIFFGPHQTQLQLVEDIESEEAIRFCFHTLEDAVTMVSRTQEGFEIRSADDDFLTSFAVYLMPEGYLEREAPQAQLELRRENTTQFVYAQSSGIGEAARELAVFHCDGWLCRALPDESVTLLSPGEFVDSLLQIIKGEEE